MTALQPGEYDVSLNGINIHYTVQGSGPVILAHSGGPGFDARGWDDFAKIDEFLTVVAIHPRGSGLSEAPTDPMAYKLADYAADLEALRQHLGLEKPIVMGWSHGGMVVQEYAYTYPDSLSKLVLYDTSAYFGEFLGDLEAAVQAFKEEPWFEKSFEALQKEWAGEYETDEDMGLLWEEEVKFYFKTFNERAQAYHQRTKHLPLRIAPLQTFNEHEVPTMDLRQGLTKVTVPTLIIVGRHDFITNVAMAEEMSKHIPDARLEIFEESGHFCHVEEPEKFYATLHDFALS